MIKAVAKYNNLMLHSVYRRIWKILVDNICGSQLKPCLKIRNCLDYPCQEFPYTNNLHFNHPTKFYRLILDWLIDLCINISKLRMEVKLLRW